jgi:selenide,water dikinase
MGGTPVLALNIAALPPNLPVEMSQQIILGMTEKMKETGGVIAGGHTITDDEPKVGLAVVGLTHPAHILTKAGAKPGDRLVLTKPLGTGCITTAAKNDKADKAHVDGAVEWMMKLNRSAAEAAQVANATAATDITGFGFLGHASELAISSEVTLHLEFGRFEFLAGAKEYAERMIFPGGSFNNKLAYEKGLRFADGISEEAQMLLFDAQTSGGLLIALPAENLKIFAREMAAREAPFWQIGRVDEKQDRNIIVSP